MADGAGGAVGANLPTAPPQHYLALTLEQWLAELSVARTAPASGAALAYTVASAAALIVKAARLSAGAGGVSAQAGMLLERAAALVQRDADVYEQALEVRASASALAPERRDWEVGRAYAAAAEPPLEIARLAADVATLAAALTASVDDRFRADVAAAAALSAGAARGAVSLVAANLTAARDDPRVAEVEERARAAEEAALRTVG